ncbi:MAG: hypothetical protein AAGA72_04185 [Pseudomonadota bacterium]
MSLNPPAISPVPAIAASAPAAGPPPVKDESALRFEQLLWAELLTHTGLEKSLTFGGGDGASMFARYFVEAIAADIAKQHPLGLLDKDLATMGLNGSLETEAIKDATATI